MAYQNPSPGKHKRTSKRQLKPQTKRRIKQQIEQLRFANLLVKFFSQLSIGQKLNVGLGVLVLMTFLVVARNYASSLSASRNIEQTRQVRMPIVLASTQAQEDLLRMSAHVRGYLITGRAEFRDRYYASRQNFEENLADMIGMLEADLPSASSSTNPKEQLAKLKDRYEQWRQIPDSLFVLSDQLLENQPALKIFQEQGELALIKAQSDTQKLLDLQTQRTPSEQNTQLIREISAFQSAFALSGSSLRAYLITRTSDFRFEYAGQQRVAAQHWDAIINSKSQLAPSQQALVESISTYRQQLLNITPEMLAIAEGDRYREDLFIFNRQAEPIAVELLSLLDNIVINQRQLLEDELAFGEQELIRAQWQTLFGSLMALGVALSMAVLLRQKIANPIVRLTQATAQIIEGNFDAKTTVESQDEVGKLAETFNRMTGYLKQSHQHLEQSNRVLEHQKQELESKNSQVELALAALQETQSQLIQAEKMSSLGQMVAGIAHEINNPVSFIRGNLPCLRSYTADLIELIQLYQRHYPQAIAEITEKSKEIELPFLLEDIPHTLTSMETGTERIRDIVLSLRNFSRLDESEMKEVKIQEGLESTLLILKSRLERQTDRQPIKLTRQYEKLSSVECYPGQLNQVFLNVLTNAIDAIDDTNPQLKPINWQPKITLRMYVQAGKIIIEIEDNAEGIKPSVQDRIFDPFFTTKPVGKGTGMGLSVTHKIVVDRHNGSLDCVSTPGEGTTFTIALPQKQTDEKVKESSA